MSHFYPANISKLEQYVEGWGGYKAFQPLGSNGGDGVHCLIPYSACQQLLGIEYKNLRVEGGGGIRFTYHTQSGEYSDWGLL